MFVFLCVCMCVHGVMHVPAYVLCMPVYVCARMSVCKCACVSLGMCLCESACVYVCTCVCLQSFPLDSWSDVETFKL